MFIFCMYLFVVVDNNWVKIVGIVVGGAVAIVIVVFAVLCLKKQHSKHRATDYRAP